MSATMARSSATGNPSSITKAADSHRGSAPSTARSLTVPWTARWPMEPPGKRSGCTTKESVVKASRSPSGRDSVAASASGARSPTAKASRNTASTRAADALPPAPWAIVTTSSVSRGARRRWASMRSSTRASRSPTSAIGRLRPRRPRRCCTASQRAKPRAACVSWIRCTLSDCTTRQCCTSGEAPISPPSYPANPIVTSRRARACAKAVRTLPELPLVENPTATSPGAAWAMSCRTNTSSNPTSLPSAVSTAVSSTRQRAGRARPWAAGRRARRATPRRSSCRRCRR